LKAAVADRVTVNVETLPLDPDVLSFLQAEKQRGRRIYLASASDYRFVNMLAAHIGLFEGVFATRDGTNLSGIKKREALVEAFGECGFDYIGNSSVDVPIWQAARTGYVVRNGLSDPARAYDSKDRPLTELVSRPPTLKNLFKLLRVHQWAKNLLIFVPLILGGASDDIQVITRAIACFIAFGLIASSTYVANDIIDIENDRKHRIKKSRSLASGNISIISGIALAFGTATVGFAIAAFLGMPILLSMLAYVVATSAYSWRLKRAPIVDATLLAGLYTWRLFIGILVAGVMLSPWLMAFSFSFFLSLCLAKRHAEISEMIAAGRTALPGRGYRTCDAQFVMSMGIAAGLCSVVIFVLYLIEGAFRAAHFTWPELLWACPVILMLWLCRIWLLCGRGELHDDPVKFAITDRKSLILGIIGAGAVALSLIA
jgi:4-hydroxybenzoate polyprenyltransferase